MISVWWIPVGIWLVFILTGLQRYRATMNQSGYKGEALFGFASFAIGGLVAALLACICIIIYLVI